MSSEPLFVVQLNRDRADPTEIVSNHLCPRRVCLIRDIDQKSPLHGWRRATICLDGDYRILRLSVNRNFYNLCNSAGIQTVLVRRLSAPVAGGSPTKPWIQPAAWSQVAARSRSPLLLEVDLTKTRGTRRRSANTTAGGGARLSK